MPRPLFILVSVILVSTLTSCSANQETPVKIIPSAAIPTSETSSITTAQSSPIPTGNTPQASPTMLSGYPAPSTNTGASGAEAYPRPAGDQISTSLPKGVLPAFSQDAPIPKPGMVSISGTIFSYTTNLLLPKTSFYLTLGWGAEKKEVPLAFTGPDPKKGDITGMTDAKGQFQFDNIPPGNYYLAVSAPYSWAIATKSSTDITPLLISLLADQKAPLGIVYVSWP